MPLIIKPICTLLFCLFFNVIFSQTIGNKSNYYLAYDSVIGLENSALYNGMRYIDRYRSTVNNHRFYNEFNFASGDVVYDDQPFFKIPMKYDLQADVLVIKITGDNAFFNLELITEKVSDFWLSNTHFKRLDDGDDSSEFKGFAKLLYSGEQLELYNKLKKNVHERFKNNSIIHEFSDSNTFIIKFNNNINEIDSKKSLKKLFPSNINLIDAFYSKFKNIQKTNSEKFYKDLIESLDKNLVNQVEQ